MSETVIFQGPSGTTIDATALEAELAAAGMALRTEDDHTYPISVEAPGTEAARCRPGGRAG